ncbi:MULTISPECIES: fimbrial protein [unclassified Serratia (in: enterobacteria)]|uniref:fimbrial protein n=1 Tax=unclassified Serratia (in: enterobacteria) TaxID=2647522 RepID=UPI003B42DE40
MNTKKRLIPVMLLAANFAVCAGAYANQTATGKLDVTGTVVATTCTVAQSELTKTITFADVDGSTLGSAAVNDKIAGSTQALTFDVTGCPGTGNASIRFDYTPQATTTDYLTNTGTSKGVLVGINEKGKVPRIAPAGLITAAITAGNATINAEANLYKAAAAVGVGTIASVMNVTVVSP